MNWQPIETYDALKKKPKLAAFLFKSESGPSGRNYLYQTVQLSRVFGSRICTHWVEIPEPPKP